MVIQKQFSIYKWSYHLILFLLYLGFFTWSFYLAAFVEGWYNMKESYQTVDVLMSFLSVQVLVMTMIYLFFYLTNFKNKDYGVYSSEFRMTMMSWNLIVFLIFWMGVVYFLKIDPNELSKYSTKQIICTAMTHFVFPLALFIIYWFEVGYKKIAIFSFYKQWWFYVAGAYLILYLGYVVIRSLVIKETTNNYYIWPYPFLDFDDLFIDVPLVIYILILCGVFFIWLWIQNIVLIAINNLKYKRRIIFN